MKDGPYERLEDLPEEIRRLPQRAQELFRAQYNVKIQEDPGDVEEATKAAWGAVQDVFRPDERGLWDENLR